MNDGQDPDKAQEPETASTRIEFASDLAGRRATCDGGQALPGGQLGARETFVGTLSGRRLVYGDPPWQWLELIDVVQEPEGELHDHVWCDEACVFVDG